MTIRDFVKKVLNMTATANMVHGENSLFTVFGIKLMKMQI